VALLDALGPQKFVARLAHAGLPLRLPRGAEPNLAMILGGTEARLEDLVGAYAALQRDGLAAAPRLRIDEPLRERRLLSPGAAWIVREMLQSAPRPGEVAERFDTSLRSDLAWKTGTSYGFRDAWALGASGGAIVGVWIGRPDGTPLPGQYGAITALPLLFAISDSLPRELRATATPRPSNVAETQICWPLGRTRETTPPDQCHRTHSAWTLDGTVPPTLPIASTGDAPSPIAYRRDMRTGLRIAGTCTRTHEETLASIAPWPTLAYPWLDGAERKRATLPDLTPDCSQPTAPRADLSIVGVVTGSVLRPPSNGGAPPQVSLHALGTREAVRWLLNGRLIGESIGDAPFIARLDEPGPQRLLALDARGRYAQIDLRVMP
jgi:penicillin-binding protein 1C